MTAAARLLYLWEQPTDVEAFVRHYREIHIPLARKLAGLRSYTITDNPEPLRGEPYFRVSELVWDSMDELRAAFASPEGRACADDVAELMKYSTARAMILGAGEQLL